MGSYEHVISEVVKVVEAFGAGIMVLGGLGAFLVFAFRVVTKPAFGSPALSRTAFGATRADHQQLCLAYRTRLEA